MFEEIKEIKSGKKELREFGLTVGVILVILGSVALWRGKAIAIYLLGPGIFLVASGLAIPRILKPLHKIWMSLAIIIGFFVSRIILSLLFCVVLTPVGLALRIFGKDTLDRRIEKSRDSYWLEKENKIKDKASYENQY